MFKLLPAVLVILTGVFAEIPVLNDESGERSVPQKWFRYGAYFSVDDLIISTDFSPVSGTVSTCYTVYKKIRILNAEGTEFGTVFIPRYTDNLDEFHLKIVRENGEDVPVKTGPVRRQYLETGKVVVPRVHPGSGLIRVIESGIRN